MRLFNKFFLAVGLLTSLAFFTFLEACKFPVYPINLSITIDGGYAVAEIENNVVYWHERVVGDEITKPNQHTEGMRRKLEEYINNHLFISLEGVTLTGELIKFNYEENPWVSRADAKISMFVRYGLGGAKTGKLSVKSVFFNEHYEHLKEGEAGHHGEEFLVEHVFETRLCVASGKPFNSKLNFDSTAAVFNLEDHFVNVNQRLRWYFIKGVKAPLVNPMMVFFIILLIWNVLSVRERFVRFGMFCFLYCIGVVLSEVFHLPRGLWIPIVGWLCVIFCALAGLSCKNATVFQWLAAPAAVGLGMSVARWVVSELIVFEHVPVFSAVSLIGTLLVLFVLTGLLHLLFSLYLKRLSIQSEAASQRKFLEHMRFLVTLVLIISIVSLVPFLRMLNGVAGK